MKRGSRGVALCMAAAVLLTGCFNTTSESDKDRGKAHSSASAAKSTDDGAWDLSDDDFAAAAKILDERARAVLRHNKAAFVATLDPSDPSFVAAQKIVFDNLQKLGIRKMYYELDPSGINSELDGGSDPTLRPVTTFEHVQINGVDKRPTASEVTVDFVRRDGRWLVGAYSMVDLSGDTAASAPWSGAPITVSRRQGILVVIDDKTPLTLNNVETLVSDGLTADAKELGIPAARDLLVDATTADHDFAMSSLDEKGGAAATTYATLALSEFGHTYDGIAGWRISINPEQVGSYESNSTVVRHELVHFLLRDHNGYLPLWLSEGMANYIAYRPYSVIDLGGAPPAVLRTLKNAQPGLPVTSTFGLEPDLNYALATIVVDHLVRAYGLPKVLDLMDTYEANAPHMQGTRDVDLITNRVLKQELGITEKQLVRAVWDRIRGF